MIRPRVSIRRVFLALVLLIGLSIFWINVLHETLFNRLLPEKPQIEPSAGYNNGQINSGQEFGKDLQPGKIVFDEATKSPAGESFPNNKPWDSSTQPRPWFVNGGVEIPKPATRDSKTGKRVAKLLPSETSDDRIPEQLMFIPPEYTNDEEKPKLKKILLPNGLPAWNIKEGRHVFNHNNCPVSTCEVMTDLEAASYADAVMFKDYHVPLNVARPTYQIWIMYHLECPYHTPIIKNPDAFNWTATYRRDSDVVAPYERWYYYNPAITQNEYMDRNYAMNKTKKVAWFVSNCGARNHRLQYAHELSKYIQVDIYGSCGTKKCPRYNADKCFDLLDKDYKFYLAFENSNCRDYITEKFFVNGLGRNILPIVMGARPEDYEVAAPHNSYIHVDEFEGPKELAEYLHRLDKDDDLYNSYFKWKGTGEFINTYFWCRICAMLHDDPQTKYYRNLNEWWRGKGICTRGSWRKRKLYENDNDDPPTE